MPEQKSIREIAGTHLGARTYHHTHQPNPALLVALPRALMRQEYSIGNISEEGYDVWRAYEFSTLCVGGLPVVGILIITYDMHSSMLLESKSLKMYLHSFVHYQWRLANHKQVERAACERITADLSVCVGIKVDVRFVPLEDAQFLSLAITNYQSLEQQVRNMPTNHQCVTDALETQGASADVYRIHSYSLMSRCRVTNQPDWGDVFVAMESSLVPTALSFFVYISRFRQQNHFHEECCETLFDALMQACQPRRLGVLCMYTRRGGIDINPVRTTGFDMAQEVLAGSWLTKTTRQ